MQHIIELIVTYQGPLLQILIAVITAALAVVVAICVYFRQRHYEMIVTRYLNEGVDLIQSELQTSVHCLAHNWARWLDVLKEYREFKDEFDPSHLELGFIPHQSGRFNFIANCRLLKITKSSEIFALYQMAISSFDNANSKLASEFPSSIAFAIKSDKVKVTPEKLAEEYAKEAERLWDENQKWYTFITEIQHLTDFLEQRRLSYSKLNKLHKKSEVIEFIDQLKDRFKEELASEIVTPGE